MEYFLFFKNGYYTAATMEDYYLISMLGGVDGALAMALVDYGLKYPDQMKIMADRMNKELEQAKSLMSEEDRIKEWKKSDYGKMVSLIENNYSAKFRKDEFETANLKWRNELKSEVKEKEELIEKYKKLTLEHNIAVIEKKKAETELAKIGGSAKTNEQTNEELRAEVSKLKTELESAKTSYNTLRDSTAKYKKIMKLLLQS